MFGICALTRPAYQLGRQQRRPRGALRVAAVVICAQLGGWCGAEELRLPAATPQPAREFLRLPAPEPETGAFTVSTPGMEAFAATDREPESLADAWQAALALDPWLDAKRQQTLAAESNWQAARAEAYPWLDTGANYTVRDNEPGFAFQAPGLIPPGSVFPYAQREGASYFAAVNMPIYTGGSVPAAIDAAAASLNSRQLDARIAQLDLKLRIAEQYVAVLRAHSDVSRAQMNVQSLASHLHDVEMLFQHEQRPQNDVLAAQVALAEARHDLVAAENRLDVARATYNRGLARPLGQPVFLYDLAVQPPPGELEALTQVAIESREELAQLRSQAQALQHEAESLLAKNRPQAAVTGGYVFQENRYQSPQGITSLGVGVTWNLYDAGRDRHRATALQQQAAALCRLRDDLESQIRLDVRRTWLDVAETAERLQVTRDSLGQAEESLRVARQRYLNGMGTSTDVLTADSQRVRSFRNHHHAYYDAILAEYRLRRAMGRL